MKRTTTKRASTRGLVRSPGRHQGFGNQETKTLEITALFTFQTLVGLNTLAKVSTRTRLRGLVGAVGGTRTHILPITNRALFVRAGRSSSATTARKLPRFGNPERGKFFWPTHPATIPRQVIQPKREIALSPHSGLRSAQSGQSRKNVTGTYFKAFGGSAIGPPRTPSPQSNICIGSGR